MTSAKIFARGGLGPVTVQPGYKSRTKFSFLTGDCNWQKYGGTFVSKRFTNGEFNYWLTANVCRDPSDEEYCVSLNVVAPEEAGEELFQAIKCWGCYDADMLDFLSARGELALVELLSQYGCYATVFEFTGKNIKKIFMELRRNADHVVSMLGFYMDGTQNNLGATGWDVLRGNLYGSIKRPPSSPVVVSSDIKSAVEAIIEKLKKYHPQG